jgi:signal transduction histidine kinase
MASTFPHSGRILIVDDQAANLRVVSTLLTRNGYEVDTAENGEAMFAACKTQMPDLVLLDMLMPMMDGFEVLTRMKQDEVLMRVPVICLTAMQDRDLLIRACEAGAVDYITKPFLSEELLARVSAHVGLKLTRDRLERVASERQSLVNLVAHDLKNPLTSIMFASEVIIHDGCKPERVPRYLEMIHESANDAVGYIRRYLESQDPHKAGLDNAANIGAGLNETLEWLRSRYELQCESKGLALSIVNAAEDVLVAIDAMVLHQVCENLITNALKYATEGGELKLTARKGAPGFGVITAEDRGPGIPAHKQRELFKAFIRLTDEEEHAEMSSGLGLSLARQIVSRFGGQLFYEDREGGGSRFVVELPLRS